MDITAIAEALLRELDVERLKATESAKLTEGAMMGVQLLYKKIDEAVTAAKQGQTENEKEAEGSTEK